MLRCEASEVSNPPLVLRCDPSQVERTRRSCCYAVNLLKLKEFGKLEKSLQVNKKQKRVFCNIVDPKRIAWATVNSLKGFQSLANTNYFASHDNRRRSQNPGKVARNKARGRCRARELVCVGVRSPP